MSEVQIVYPPNKPLERVLVPSKDPIRYEHLLFIDVNDKEEVLLGCSNVTGAYWEGTLFFYANGDAALTNDYANYYISGSSISDAVFIPNTEKVLLAEDTSCLRLLSITAEASLKCQDVFNSNALIEQLAVWDCQKVLSCGGNYVSIWDVENENIANPIEEYKNVHTDTVKSVAIKPNDNFVFATASLDRKACIWDNRMKIPVSVLYQNEFTGLTAIVWNRNHVESIVIGSLAGDLYEVDMRYPKEFKSNHRCFDVGIHRLKFNSSGYLAVCGDTNNVLVLNSEKTFEEVSRKSDHSGLARGVGWYKNILYTCGFDKKVNRYNI